MAFNTSCSDYGNSDQEFHGLPGTVTPSFKAGVVGQNFYCADFTDVEIWIQIGLDHVT